VKAKRLLDPTVWANVATETWLRRSPRYVDDAPLSWPLDGVERLTVRWPEQLARQDDAIWVTFIRQGIAGHARVETAPIEQPRRGVVFIGVDTVSRSSTVVIDYADDVNLNSAALRKADLYFKMQYLRGGYGDERVVPGGFPPNQASVLTMLGPLRRLHDRGSRDHEVSGRFSVGFATDVRTRAVGILAAQEEFGFTGGLHHVRYSAFLREVARSQVCIDLPGNGPFCFRLVDYLAIGACIVAAPHKATMHVPFVDGEQLVYTQPDLSDIVEVCSRLLDDAAERERLSRNAREYFDRYLTPRQIGAYYLRRCVEVLA
jgi:hypothetical protein